MMTLQNTSTPTLHRTNCATPTTGKAAWEWDASDYTLKTTENKFTDAKARDIKSGTLNVETEMLVDAVLMPGKTGLPKVQVKTFAVDGIQSKDMIVIEQVPAEPNRLNIVLFMPQEEGNSFVSFENKEQMDKWLKEVAKDPDKLEKFSAHFSEGGGGVRDKRVKEVMTQYGNDDINAIVGPYVHVQGNVFEQLDREINSPPASVNGLTNLQRVKETDTGRTLYSGQRADAETVLYEYDAYGNLLGAGNKGNYYFLQNGINSTRPLIPMTQKEFVIALQREISKNVGADDLRGLFDELVAHLEHPFQGIGEALEALGVSKSAADTVERYLDNPFSALLLDLNKNNQIGKVFGVDKATMDGALKGAGDVAQGFVPYYGQGRMLGSLLAKAIRNEPLNDQEQRDLADALALKPDSPARQNLSARESSGARRPFSEVQNETETQAPVQEKPIDSSGLKGSPPVEEIPVQNGKLIKLGGTMESLTEVDDELFTFVDLNKKDKQVRLNILAHGEEPDSWSLNTDTKTPARIIYDGKPHTPQELLDTLKAKGIDPSEYDNVRLLMCYSGNGKNNSFAAEFSRLIGKPVKGYEGTLSAYVLPETINELKDMTQNYIAQRLDAKEELLPVERRAVNDISTQYVKDKFASIAFKIAKKNPHYNPIKAWTFTYRPVTFSPTL